MLQDWNDVALTLETTTPSYGVNIPTLNPWWINIQPVFYKGGARKSASKSLSFSMRAPGSAQYDYDRGLALESTIDSISSNLSGVLMRGGSVPTLTERETIVETKGGNGVIASFQVPGIVNIPSDGTAHTFTIVKLDLSATLSWLAVPKQEQKVHLQASLMLRL